MHQSLRTIAIEGGYGRGNFGDDALMVAVYQVATRVFETQSITFLCPDSGYIQRILPGVKVVSSDRENRPIADILLYGGGTQFYSFPLTSQRGIRFLFKVIARNALKPVCLGQKVYRKMMEASSPSSNLRVAAIGIGLGPFIENCNHMWRIKKMFSRMDYVAVRDVYSYDLCKKWGYNNVSLRSDLCYLPGLWKTGAPDTRMDNRIDEIKRVGIIIRDWPHTSEGDSYVGPLFQVVDELRSAGKDVEYISFADSDSEWIKRLNDRDEQHKTWNPEKLAIVGFLELLSGYDAFITARYHGAVFASILGKPVICIEVEQKLRLVSDLFGYGARLWTYPFSTSECLRHIYDIEGDYLRSVESMARVVQEQGALAEKIVDELSKVYLHEL
ncbi:MAG: polysaccharide pyruvyl transferase family protein [Candidatus Berkelbacteria bacterium]|nr:polysaccharide pyruvyl transferase family protein [Candidatus Berkelbacteria bacterium]